MQKGDYRSLKQADKYYRLRFRNLSQVKKDEMLLLERWLKATGFDNSVSLDLGTGTGRIVKMLLKHNPKKVYALDRSEAMLEYLNQLYKKGVNAKKVQTIKATSDKIPIKSSTIDVVTAFHLFKHLPKIEPTLKEANRILKTNGYLIFDVLNANSVIRFNLGTCYALAKSSLLKALNKNGFNCLEVIALHVFGETVYNFPGAAFINLIDKLLIKIGLPLGTKLFVLAQKDV